MSFFTKTINDTAARKVAALSRQGREAVEALESATHGTFQELWNGSESPEALAEAMGTDGLEACELHAASVQFLANVKAIREVRMGTPDSTAQRAAIVEAFAAQYQPPRQIIPNVEEGSITIAPES